jgi:hypothetical protein
MVSYKDGYVKQNDILKEEEEVKGDLNKPIIKNLSKS